jgi:hypothetical protein
MSTTCSTGVIRFDIDDPDDLADLVRTGLIWKGGPKAIAKAVTALLDGTLPRPPNLPPQVAGYLRLLEPDHLPSEK